MRGKFTIASAIAVALLIACDASGQAADGAALYKTKCAGCHGAKGEGKPAMKAPALKGSALSADQIEQVLVQGAAGKKAPHAKAISGLTAEQARAIADYVKTL
jgi:mono/diheme cytochrome c family protein